MRSILLLIFILFAVGLAGCSSRNDTPPLIKISYEQSAYIFSDNAYFPVTIKNLSKVDIQFSLCDSRDLIELKDGKVAGTTSFSNPCECICLTVLEPDSAASLNIFSSFVQAGIESDHLNQPGYTHQIKPRIYFSDGNFDRISNDRIESASVTFRFE